MCRGKKIDQAHEELSDSGTSAHRVLQLTYEVSHYGITVAFEGRHKELVLPSEGTVQTEAINTHALDKRVHRGGSIAVLPKDLHRFLECLSGVKRFGAWHGRFSCDSIF
jgi:hypothetical protein